MGGLQTWLSFMLVGFIHIQHMTETFEKSRGHVYAEMQMVTLFLPLKRFSWVHFLESK